MRLLRGLHFILLVSLMCLSYFSNAQDYIELITAQIRPISVDFGLPRDNISGLDCRSWRLAVETNNLRNWATVPLDCKDYVEDYITGKQYKRDAFTVTAIAYDYVKSVQLNDNGRDIWVFDIDDTCLDNTPYYARPDVGFGAYTPNGTSFSEWVAEAKAPANRACLSLYRRLLRLGVKMVFLTGIREQYREARELNMKNAGYNTWEMMILRNSSETGMTALEFKSRRRTELEKMGYRIIGNMGDQRSDISGPHPGLRTFKMPNPMVYLA